MTSDAPRPGAGPLAGPAPRLRRDGVTAFAYLTLCAWGWFLYSLGVVVPLLREEQGTTRAVAALHSTASASGGVLAGLLAAAVVARWRRRGAAIIGSAVSAAGTLVFLVGSPTLLTLAATFVIGVGGAMLANVTIPMLMQHHGASGTAALSEGNGLSACFALVAPLAVGASVALGWGWQPALAVYLPLLILVMWLLRRIPRGVPAADGGPVHDEPGPPQPVGPAHDPPCAADVPAAGLAEADPRAAGGALRGLSRRYWLYVVVVMCSVGVEFTMATWSGDLVATRTGVSTAAGTALVSLVIAGMASGRFLIGRLALRLPEVPLLLGALALTFTGWFVVWSSTTVPVAAAGLLLTGWGIAGQYPLGMTLTVRAAPANADRAVGVAGAAIAVAIGSAPFALGALADASDIHTAFLVVPTLIAAAAILLVLVRSRAVSAA